MNKAAEILLKLDELLLAHYPKLDTPGLLKGKMGVCLYFFEAFHHNNNPRYRQAAQSILQEVYTSIHQSPIPTYFDNGLAGIAWGIHRLIKMELLEGNADELLEQIDNVLFKVISEKSEELEFGVKRGLLGYLVYVLDRLTKLPDKQGFHISKELFTSLAALLINRVHLRAETGMALFTEPARFHLFWDLPSYLFILAEAARLRLFPEKIKQMIKDITPTVLSSLPQNLGNRLNLYGAIKRLGVNDWEHHACLLKNGVAGVTLSSFGLLNKSLYVENGLAGLILLNHQIKSDFGDFEGIFSQKDMLQEAFLHLEKSEYWEYLSTSLDHELGLLYGITGISFSILQLFKENSIIRK